MVDATILVPTHRHVPLLPHALASALDQEGATVELFVVGDGVEDATREVVGRHANDPRVRFFDFPKGPRNGEAYRHEVLQEAGGRIVCYLSDDDLLLRDHAAEMCRLLGEADFAMRSRRASVATASSRSSPGTTGALSSGRPGASASARWA